LDSSGFVYDSLDNWLIHPQLKQYASVVTPAYQRICSLARRVVVSAPRSRDVMSRWTDRVDVIPNGVTVATFEAPTIRPADLPPSPIVGYAGSLGPRVDAAFVTDVARRLPWVNFVFIGQTLDRSTVGALRRQPNVKVLGDRHYDRLPAYIQAFDVAWIPHTVGDGESGGDPIKMYEYWAAGREVVSTPIDGLATWAASLHLVESAEMAAIRISGLLDGTVPPVNAPVPPQRTWSVIADRLLRVLEPDSAEFR
jgi:glycosyltransferase involved in cell wall biosynthesis